MDLTRIEELIELMRRSGLMELSLEVPDYKVSIKRGAEGRPATVAREAAASQVSQEVAVEAEPETTALPVVAPVVGVFHNGGMLDPREMVKVGDRVEEGQLLAAIEAMKVPNELHAPVGGTISRLLVEDGAAVEYGQTLLFIQPDEEGEAGEDEEQVGLA